MPPGTRIRLQSQLMTGAGIFNSTITASLVTSTRCDRISKQATAKPLYSAQCRNFYGFLDVLKGKACLIAVAIK